MNDAEKTEVYNAIILLQFTKKVSQQMSSTVSTKDQEVDHQPRVGKEKVGDYLSQGCPTCGLQAACVVCEGSTCLQQVPA